MKAHPFHASLRRLETTLSVEGISLVLPIEYRTDPLIGMHTTLLSQVRCHRPGKPRSSPLVPSEKATCVFEPELLHKTPEPRVQYPAFVRDGYIPVTVPNRYPYALEGKVTSFTSHERAVLTHLERRDWTTYLLLSHHLMTQDLLAGHTSSFNFINYGRGAGGSQEHPHFQSGIVAPPVITHSDRERFWLAAHPEAEPFQEYIERSQEAGLLCASQGDTVIVAPYAPRFPDQLDILPTFPCPHLLACEEEHLASFASSLTAGVRFLAQERGVTDLNIVLHQERLDVSSSPYRLHFHLYPRNKNVLAGCELGSELYVVDTYPEDTAHAFRTWHAKQQT